MALISPTWTIVPAGFAIIFASCTIALRPSVLRYDGASIKIECNSENESFVLNAQEGTLLKSDMIYDDVNWIETKCKLKKPTEMEDSKHEEVLEFWRPDFLLFTDAQNLLLLKKTSIHCYASDDSRHHAGVNAFDSATIPDDGLQYSCSSGNSTTAFNLKIFQECVEVSARSTNTHSNLGDDCHNRGKWMIDDVGNFVCSKCCPGSRWYRDELECEKCPEHSTSKKTNVLVSACHRKRKDTRKPVTEHPILTTSTLTRYNNSMKYPVMLPDAKIPPSSSEIILWNVTVSDITPHSVLVEWNYSESDWNDRYHVEVNSSKHNQTRDTSEMHMLVRGLSPNMQYEVSVSVKNRDGHEARSQPKTFKTLRKCGVWQLEIANIGARNVTVSWKILTEQAIQSDATAFKIYYKAAGGDKRVDVPLTDMAFASASAHFRVRDVGNYTLYMEHQSGDLVSKNFSISLESVQKEDADSVGSNNALAIGLGIFGGAGAVLLIVILICYLKYCKRQSGPDEGGNNNEEARRAFLHQP